jgi:copper chaperone CopZ
MSSTITTTLPVNGMTCGHCVQAVTQELTQLDGVQDVAVELIPDGTSRVTVTSATPLDDAAVRAAIDEAGYDIRR